MIIATSRFGRIEVGDSDVITFPDGIIGFHDRKRYALVTREGESPFQWLQCVDDPELAFVVIDPRIVLPDYTVEAGAAEMASIGLADAASARILAIVVIPPDDVAATRVNLRGPLVVNTQNSTARQIVLSDSYPLRYHIYEGSGNACTHA